VDRSSLPGKEPDALDGQALFCFAWCGLNWLGLSVAGTEGAHSLAYVGSPARPGGRAAVVQAVLLTTRRATGWGCAGRYPSLSIGLLLGVLLCAGGHPVEETLPIFRQCGGCARRGAATERLWCTPLVLAALPAVCQELASRVHSWAGCGAASRCCLGCVISSLLYAVVSPERVPICRPSCWRWRGGCWPAQRQRLAGMGLHLVHNGLLFTRALPWPLSGTESLREVIAVPWPVLLAASALCTAGLLWC